MTLYPLSQPLPRGQKPGRPSRLHTAPSRWSWLGFPHQTCSTLASSLVAPAVFGEKCVLCQCCCACEVRGKSTPIVAACSNGDPSPACFPEQFYLSCTDRTTSACMEKPLPGASPSPRSSGGKGCEWIHLWYRLRGAVFSCSTTSQSSAGLREWLAQSSSGFSPAQSLQAHSVQSSICAGKMING